MPTDAISAARLGVFIAFLPLSNFCLFKHGRVGFFGWLYVALFCVLRVITGGMGLHGDQTGETFVILNSIGLSPLILAAAGVLHEARRATNARLSRKLDIFLEVQFHLLIGTGMALVVVAIVNLMRGGSTPTNKQLLYAGSALTCLAWLILSLWALLSVHKMRRLSVPSDPTMNGGKTLLISVLMALPLIALRLGYAITYLNLIISRPGSGFLSSIVVSVCLNVVPEMLCVGLLLLAGLLTSSLKRELKKRDQGFVPGVEL